MSNYYYKKSEPGLWTVGTGEGKNWEAESDHTSPQEAAGRVNFLNGGGTTITMEEVNKKGKETEQFQIFRAAFILHKYFIKGNLRPIENFASMIVDIATEQDYEDKPVREITLFVEAIKNALDVQLTQMKESSMQPELLESLKSQEK